MRRDRAGRLPTGSFVRFLLSGWVNTAISYLVYVFLLLLVPYAWAYTIAYAAGIALSYSLSRYFVFGRSGGRYGPALVVFIYGLQYLVGLWVVWVWVDILEGWKVVAPLFSVLLQLPMTYGLNWLVFRGR